MAAVFGQADGVARFRELLLQQGADGGLVIHNQNGIAARMVARDIFAQLANQRFDIDRARRSRSASLEGKRERERAALAGFAFHPDTAPMVFDNFLADRKDRK